MLSIEMRRDNITVPTCDLNCPYHRDLVVSAGVDLGLKPTLTGGSGRGT